MRKVLLPLAAAALVASSVAGHAANSSASFNAKIKINAGCTVSAADLSFPAATLLAGTETTTSTVGVTCTKTTPWALSLSNVTAIGSVTTTATGSMAGVTVGNTDTIAYGISFTTTPSGTGTGAVQNVTMQGAITTTGGVTPDDYAQARTVYVVY